jgi:hypothetical protein
VPAVVVVSESDVGHLQQHCRQQVEGLQQLQVDERVVGDAAARLATVWLVVTSILEGARALYSNA